MELRAERLPGDPLDPFVQHRRHDARGWRARKRGNDHQMARGALLCVLCALALGLARGAAPSADAPPQVTVIGDSVATAITSHDDVHAAAANGLRVDWHVDICRRVSELSCPFQGARPPTL